MKPAQRAGALLLAAAGFGAGLSVAPFLRAPVTLPATPIMDSANPDILALVRLQTSLAAAFAPLDSGVFVSLMAPDAQAINAGDQVLDRDAAPGVLASAQAGLVRVVDDSIRVRLHGPVAIMTLREAVTFRADSAESTGYLRMTEVWFKRAGRWEAVGSHATALRERP